MGYTNNSLVDRVESKAALPEGRYTTAELLDQIYRTLISEIVPIVRQVHQEYYVVKTTVATVANTYAYSIPTRAMGRALREIKRVNGTTQYDLPIGGLEYENTSDTGAPQKAWIEGDKVIVWPTPTDATDSLNMWYYRRPSILVEDTAGFVVTAIDTGTNTVSVSGVPTWTTANTLDVVSPSGDFTIREMDLSFTSITVSDFVFATLPTNLSVGDYLCLAGESVYAQLPVEAHEMLITLTAANVLFEMGDRENGTILPSDGERLAQAYLSTVNPRIVGAPKAFTTRLV